MPNEMLVNCGGRVVNVANPPKNYPRGLKYPASLEVRKALHGILPDPPPISEAQLVELANYYRARTGDDFDPADVLPLPGGSVVNEAAPPPFEDDVLDLPKLDYGEWPPRK